MPIRQASRTRVYFISFAAAVFFLSRGPLFAQAAVTVTTNAGDQSAGSLGWAVTTLDAAGAGSISFTPPAGTVTLTQPLSPISQNATFQGSDLNLTGQNSAQARLLFQQGFSQQDNLILQNNGALGAGLDASVTASNWTMGTGVYADLYGGAGAVTSATGGTGVIGGSGGNSAVTVGNWTVGQGADLSAGNGGSVTDTNGNGDAGGAGGSAAATGNSLTAPGYFFQVSGGAGGNAADLGSGTNRGGSGGAASVTFNSIVSGPSGSFNVVGGSGGSGVTGGSGGAAILSAGYVSLTQGLLVQGGRGGAGVTAGGSGGGAFVSIGSYVGLSSSNLNVAGGAGGSGPAAAASGGGAFYSGSSVNISGPNADFSVTGGKGGDVGPTSGGPGNGGQGGDAGVSLGALSIGPGSLFQVAAGNGGQGSSGSQPSDGGRGGDTSLTLGSFSVAVSTQLSFSSGTGGGGGDDNGGGTAGDGGAGGALAVTVGNLSLQAGSNLSLSGGTGGTGGASAGGTGGAGGNGGNVVLSAASVSLVSGSNLLIQGGPGQAGGAGNLDGSAGLDGQASAMIGSLSGLGEISMSGTSDILQVASGSFGGSLQGGETLQKTGSGALTLSGGNNYGGGTGVLGGSLAVDTGGTLGTGSVLVAGGSALDYLHSSVAGGHLNVASGGDLNFQDGSSAGNAQINLDGQAIFGDSSTAGGAGVEVSSAGTLIFQGNSSAGGAQIGDSHQVEFINSSTAGNAGVTVASGGNLSFRNGSGAGNAQIDDQGQLIFFDSSNAGSALVTVENGARASFVNSAQGGTSRFIVGGALDISGSTTGVTLGTLAGDGSVTLGGEDLAVGVIHSSTAFSGVISGSGSFAKLGTDGLTLNGANAYSGGTLIAGGTLAVGNARALGTGSVTVSGGTLDLSGSGAPLTLQIGGNLVQGGTLQLGIDNGGSDAVSVAGTAALGGTLDLTSYNPVTALTVGRAVTVLAAGGSLGGMFGDVTESLGNGIRLLPLYQPGQLELEFINPSFAQAGSTPDEKAVGADLDSIYGSARVYGLVSQLGVMPVADLPAAYDRISPSGLAGLYQAGFEGAMERASLVEERLSQFKAQVGDEGRPRGFADQGMPLFAANLPARREAAMALGQKRTGDWSGFVSGDAGSFNVAPDANAPGYKATNYGLAGAGADYRVSKSMAVGLLVGYGHADVTPDTGGSLTGDGGQLGLYGLLCSGGFYADALAQGGLDSYAIQRGAYGGTATGKTRGQEYGGAVELGYEWKQEKAAVGPMISLQYTRVSIDGFSEQGSMAPLTYPGQAEDALTGRLGLQGKGNWKLGTVVLRPSIRLAWEHEYDNQGGTVQAGFGTGDGFTVAGPAIGQDGVLLGAGLDVGLSRNLEASLQYQGELNRTDLASQQFGGGVRLGF